MLAYLMTDVGGSTRLWESDREHMAHSVSRLDEVCEAVFRDSHGKLIKARGEGDSHFGVFARAEDAVDAAIRLQIATRSDPILTDLVLRMAVHLGSPEMWAGDHYGPVINRCGRIRQVTLPGQILVSEAVHAVVAKNNEFHFKDLGVHRLKDLMQPERLYQVCHPDLPSVFPHPETLSALSHNLPAYLTSFVGREKELAELDQIVNPNRLVTITGPGGVGKTRLTQQLAADLIERFYDGVWFIDLAQTDRSESVVPILFEELAAGGEVSEEKLLEAIGTRQMLIILDNCEHLFEECRRLASLLMRRCPDLHILATSRRVLDVRGECVYRLGGLSLPTSDKFHIPMEFEGFRLFVERASQRGTNLAIDATTVPGIVELCRKLDGLPLALEMAAGLTDVLAIPEITASIAECMQASTGPEIEDPRQHTIASTIEWSRRFLSDEGRLMLQRVAMFPNTWTLAAAAAVCFPGNSKPNVRGNLKELLNHSLVFSTRTTSDDLRFGLLQTTRQVVLGDSPSHDELVPDYINYFESLVESAKTVAEQGEEGRAHAHLSLEWESITLAMEFAFSSDPNRCAKMALALRGYCMSGTRLLEGKRWYRQLADCEVLDLSTQVSVQIALSSIFILLGENDAALEALLEAEETVRPIGGYQLALVIGNLAVHRDRMGRYGEAKEGFETCYQIFKQCGAAREQALSLLNIGVAKLRLGEPNSECADYYRRALEYARANDLVSLNAKALSCLAHLELKESKWMESLMFNKQALQLWLEDMVAPDCVLAMLDLAETFVSLERVDLAASAIHIADRLEELSNSPFPSVHRDRLEGLRSIAKAQASVADWRAGHRLMRTKDAFELTTMAIQLIDTPLSPSPAALR